MSATIQEKFTPKLLACLLAGVTVLVIPQSVTDPVNVTKLFLLGILSFAAFGAAIYRVDTRFFREFRNILLVTGLFVLAAFVSLTQSSAPFSQTFYGVYGRNNGFLLYGLLVLSFVSTLTIRSLASFDMFIKALFFAGMTNLIYSLWVVVFGDFIGWENIYGNLLGTLGNPNFIGSFFGMFAGLLFSHLMEPKSKKEKRLIALALLILVFYCIIRTHAVQGKILFFTSFFIVLFYFIRSLKRSLYLELIYLLLSGSGFVVALLGTLQKGPLADALYKPSVSLRGQYWYAGWQTGTTNPLTGVGFDSYGDWYRRSRRESALKLPGVDTVSNAAHNVYLDLFSFGGFPLLTMYVSLSFFVIFAIFKVTIKRREFNPIFVTLTSVWICYQMQSLISINQIGLAVWGWIFGAAIIAFEKLSGTEVVPQKSDIKRASKLNNRGVKSVITPQLIAGIAGLIGALISVPPMSADMKWRSAQLSQKLENVENVMITSYLNPQNTFRYAQIVGVLETNGFSEQAHKYALEAVKFNPQNFEMWRNLYLVRLATQVEKQMALHNMQILDPLNPNVGVPSN